MVLHMELDMATAFKNKKLILLVLLYSNPCSVDHYHTCKSTVKGKISPAFGICGIHVLMESLLLFSLIANTDPSFGLVDAYIAYLK